MRVAVVLLIAGCAAHAPSAVTLASPASHAVPVRGSLVAPPPASYAWRWVGDAPGFGKSFYRSPREVARGDLSCSFTYEEKPFSAWLACAGSDGRELWRHDWAHAFVEDAALALDGDTLYAARFSDISTGCTLWAFDARSGRVRWSRPLEGMGSIAHSEYLNSVQLEIQGGRPVVFGWESAGRYIEAVDVLSGRTVFHTIVADVRNSPAP
ncbi:MAG TPA: PQQ-binding-like beta-propeller repeat protein [Polyangiaceae bacterium]|jgi:hypothetical protein